MWRDIGGKNRRDHSGGIVYRVVSLGLAMIFFYGGLARATGGYRYLLATPPAILSGRVIDMGIKPTCRGKGLSVV